MGKIYTTLYGVHEKSLKNLNPKNRYQGKIKMNISILPETKKWLKGFHSKGNASQRIDEIVALIKNSKLVHPNVIERAEEENRQLRAYIQKQDKILDAISKIRFNHVSINEGYQENNFSTGLNKLTEIWKDIYELRGIE